MSAIPGAHAEPGARGRPPTVGEPARESTLEGAAKLLEQIADMILLTGRTIVAVITPPWSWREEAVDQMWVILKRSIVPLTMANFFIMFGALGLDATNLLAVLGTLDRGGSFTAVAGVREIATWGTAVVVAGVAGAAMCADLGARKVREELDAMAVMGLDPVRELIAPRFVALGVMIFLLNLFALISLTFGAWLGVVAVWGETTGGFIANFSSNFHMADLVAAMVKVVIFGLIVAVVCCYKGMHASGGPEGVGRAVNQAVVISFVLIWIVNALFIASLLATFPELGNQR